MRVPAFALRASFVAAFIALVALVLTPVGVWLAAGGTSLYASRLGWDLQIRRHEGSLATSARLGHVTLTNAQLGVDAEISEAALNLWAWEVSLLGPRVRLAPLPDTTSAPSSTTVDTLRLPLADLPAVDIVDGTFLLQLGGDANNALTVDMTDITATMAPAGDQALVELDVGAWRVEQGGTELAGEARTRWTLQPTAVVLKQSFARIVYEESQGTFRGTAVLELTPQLDLLSSFTVEGAVPGLDEMWLDATVAGALMPVDVRGQGHGEARHADLGPLSLQVAGGIDDVAMRVDSVRVQIADGDVDGQLNWYAAGDSLRGQVRIKGVQLQALTGSLAGLLHGTAHVSGRRQNPRIVLGLQAPAVEGMADAPVDLAVHAGLQEHLFNARVSSRRLGHLVARGPWRLDDMTYSLSLSGGLDAEPWLGRSWPLTVQGALQPDTLRVDFSSQHLPFGDDPPGPVQVDAVLSGWQYLDVGVAVANRQFTGRARIDLQTARVDTLTGVAQALSLANLSSALQGSINGHVAAAGVLPTAGRGSLGLQVDDLVLAGWSLGPTKLSTRFDAGVATITASADGLAAYARVDTAGVASLQVDLQDAVVRQHGTEDSVSVSGTIAGAGSLHDLAAGSLQADLDSVGAVLGGWSLRMPTGLRVDVDKGRAQLWPTRLLTPIGALQLQGMAASDTMLMTATLDCLHVAGVEDVSARGSAHLHVSGRPDRPRAQLSLALRHLLLGGRSIGELRMSADLSDSLHGALTLGPGNTQEAPLHVQLSAPAEVLRPGVEVGADANAQMRIVATDLDASTVATWVFDDTTGLTLSFDANVEVPANRLFEDFGLGRVTAALELQKLMLTRDRVRMRLQAPSRAHLTQGRGNLDNFTLPVEMFQRDTNQFDEAGTISLNGTLIGRGGGLELRVDDLDLLAAARAIPGRVSLPAGQLTLQANLTGSFDEPALNATANVELEELGSVGARVFGRPRAWKGSATWVTLVEDSLQVTGSAPAVNIWPKWDELTMRAHSAGIDLLPLLDQVPELESLSGFVRLDVTADSLMTSPRFAGQAEVEDLEFALLDVTPGYRFASGRIDFGAREGGGAHAQLGGFSGQTTRGAGVLQLSGFFDLLPEGDTDYNVQLTGDNVRYEYDDVFTAPDIDMDLTLRRGAQGSILEGKVGLTRPSSEIQLVDLTAPPVPPPPTLQNDLLENTRLNVYVDIDGLVTRSELSDITLDGQARIYGTFYQPRFQGELEIVDGQVIVLSRRFTFTRGRIILDRLVPTYSILDLLYDPILLDPELDIEATTSVKPNTNDPAHEVTLTLSGPVRSAAPRLTSPGLGDGEVLSLLAFGQTSTQGADYAGAFYTAAGQLLLGRQVQKVGLDEFLLLPSGTALNTVGEPAVRIGKYMSWPVPIWVRYEAITRSAGSGQFEVEYRITNWMTIDATAHSEYELYGLGIGLSREF